MKLYRIGTHKKNLIFSKNNKNEEVYPNKGKLIQIKCEIDKCLQKEWDRSKKNTNEYEYIYTSANKKKNICSVIPVSRSYFKLHEMIINFNLLKENIKCSCIAEGPGGFIHCINDYNLNYDLHIEYIYGITLISNDSSIPFWSQLITRNLRNKISYGKDKTGDIYKLENAINFIETVGNQTCYLVTADGGFDYSNDYNLQELSSYKLLFCEIYIALHIQKIGGNFVLKVFDLFSYKTLQLIYLLYNFYSIIEFYKPSTSRSSNSEKYIICSGFNGCQQTYLNKLKEFFLNPEELHIDIPFTFIDDINKYNNLFVKEQINIINKILKNIKYATDKPTKIQISNAKKWCELYKLPINNKCIYL